MVDVDSTLSAIEGIDWLASQRGEEMRRSVSETTERAMRGEISVAAVYGVRVEAVRPTRDEVAALAQVYMERIQEGAAESLAKLTNAGVKVVLVSAGFREAILPLAGVLGVVSADVHAVSVFFSESGDYSGFDAASPLTRNGGKAAIVRGLGLPGPVLGVGDGITDAELKTIQPAAVDTFAAYIGVVKRPLVVEVADHIIERFDQLPGIVLG